MRIRDYKIKHLKITLLIFILVGVFACNPTRKLKEGEYLLEKNIIVDHHSGLESSEIETYIRQQPNRKILKTLQFHLWLYNTINQRKIAPHKEKRNKKYDKLNNKRIGKIELQNKKIDLKNEKIKLKNIKRDQKGLIDIPYKPYKVAKLKDKSKLTWRESVMEAGEAPVILDSFQTKISREQIQKYMFTKGQFYGRVGFCC